MLSVFIAVNAEFSGCGKSSDLFESGRFSLVYVFLLGDIAILAWY